MYIKFGMLQKKVYSIDAERLFLSLFQRGLIENEQL